MLKYIKRRIGQIVQSDQENEFWRQVDAHRPNASAAIATRDLHHPLTDASSSDEAPLPPGTPQKVYGDGFDRIYSLETIDPSSIRPMGRPVGGCEDDPDRLALTDPLAALKAKAHQMGQKVEEEPPATIVPLPKTDSPPEPKPTLPRQVQWDQLSLALGREFENWIEPFKLSEPIQVLGLSTMAEKGLLDNRKTKIRDIAGLEKKDFVFFKGLGQGHIDEIVSKVENYLGPGSPTQAKRVDFSGLILSLLGAEDRRKAYLLAEPYGLEHLFPLSPADSAELRHLSVDAKQEMIEAATIELASEIKRRFVLDKLRDVVDAFVKPWMRSRKGIALQKELIERVQRVSDDPKLARSVLKFVTELYFENKCPFAQFLREVAPGVYCVDEWAAKEYAQIMERGRTYFYNAYLNYPLDTLESFIAREFARRWHGFPDGFIEKAVRASPRFRVRKGKGGFLEVKLA